MRFLFTLRRINLKHSVLHKGWYTVCNGSQSITYFIFALLGGAGLGSVFGLQILSQVHVLKLHYNFERFQPNSKCSFSKFFDFSWEKLLTFKRFRMVRNYRKDFKHIFTKFNILSPRFQALNFWKWWILYKVYGSAAVVAIYIRFIGYPNLHIL